MLLAYDVEQKISSAGYLFHANIELNEQKRKKKHFAPYVAFNFIFKWLSADIYTEPNTRCVEVVLLLHYNLILLFHKFIFILPQQNEYVVYLQEFRVVFLF